MKEERHPICRKEENPYNSKGLQSPLSGFPYLVSMSLKFLGLAWFCVLIVTGRGEVLWMKDDEDLPLKRRFCMRRVKTVEGEEDFTLEISSVQLEDEGRYQCKIQSNDSILLSGYSKVTVLVPPEPPKILQGHQSVAEEGKQIFLECMSSGGKPKPEVSWVNRHGEPFPGLVSHAIILQGKTYTVRSILRLRMEKIYHDMVVVCQVEDEASGVQRSDEHKLKVLRLPQVKLEVKPSGLIPEGSEVTFYCLADGYPKEMKYDWTLNGQVYSEKPRELVIEHMTRDLNEAIIECSAENAVGKTTAYLVLQVGYGPTFLTDSENIAVDVGDSVSLFCDAIGNPHPQITWTHKSSKTVVGTSPNLTLVIHNDSGGIYDCKASAPGRPDVHSGYGIFIRGGPSVFVFKDEEVLGKECEVVCVAVGTPTPTGILWRFQEKDIGTLDEDYLIREENLPNAMRSILSISQLQTKHLGSYTCSARNPYGTNSSEIILEVESRFLEIFQPVITFLFLFLTIILGIVILIRLKDYKHSF